MNLLCCCTMAPNTKVTRKWELFAGRNRFYCDGLLMSAPHTGVFYLTCFLITGTSILFFVFDCPYLATRITPAIPIVGAILYFFTMSSLLRTTFTDPGVIPRASHDEAAYIEKQIEVPNSLNSPTYRPPPRTKEVLVKGQTVKLKYCFTCKIFRPPRASHCSLCDNCVDRFDHHCPWVGNCVGKRNYRFFYMFLVSLAFLAVFIFSCSITHLVLVMKIEQEVFEVIKKAPFSVIVTFICFFSIWSVIGLAGFHTYLTTSDQTTNEDLKGSFSSKGGQRAVNPYSRGNICLNCFHILCGPMTPSLIDRRGIVTDEYILQMQHSNQYQLTDVTTTPSALITSQPMLGGAVDAISTKQRLYDENIPSSGIYRHRSYDNLQNGNSNSLAHLVDNEMPLSIIEGPCCQTDENSPITTLNNNNNNNYDDDNDNNDNDDDDDDDNIEKINNKHLNNLNGSYNNLFRDNLEDNNYCEQNEQQQQQHIQLTNLIKSTSESENVYSNIINTNQSTNTNNNNTTSTTINDDIIVTNANTTTNLPSSTTATINRLDLHLYSNLIEEQQQKQSHSLFQQQPQQHQQQQTNDTTTTTTTSSNLIIPITISEIPTQTTTTPTTPIKTINIKKSNEISSSSNNKLIINSNKNHLKVNHNSNNSNNCISNNSNNCIKTNDDSDVNRYESSSNDDIMSSTLLSDDLDLDDPVSAFVVNNTCKNKQQQQHHTSTRKMKTTTSTSAASSSSSIQPKHTNKFVNDDDKKNTSSISNNCYNSNTVDTSTSSTLSSTTTPTTTTAATTNFITPSRLRLLHDTTMIDTALDLDSLDGSSIGNNSQACLVKTAMV